MSEVVDISPGNLDSSLWVIQTRILHAVLCISEKAMAPHSSTFAWKIPWTEEPGRLQPMVSLRVGHDWATSLSLFPFMHWRRKWHPTCTPVFLPGESHGQRSLVGYSQWCRRVGHDWATKQQPITVWAASLKARRKWDKRRPQMNPVVEARLEKEEGCRGLQIPMMP